MATSQQRARPRKAAPTTAAKATPVRKKTASAKPAPGRSATTKPAPVKKAAAKKSRVAKKPAAAGKAHAAKKAAPVKKAPAPRPSKAAARTKAKPKALDPFEKLRKLVLDALDGLKARDVAEVDVRGKSSVADLLVVASGTSSRHVKSIADEVVKKAKQAGTPPIGVEGQREAEWVLVDLGDVIVHVMLPRTREFYGLERLWSIGPGSEPSLEG